MFAAASIASRDASCTPNAIFSARERENKNTSCSIVET